MGSGSCVLVGDARTVVAGVAENEPPDWDKQAVRRIGKRRIERRKRRLNGFP